MLDFAKFQSNYYQPIKWQVIFDRVGCDLSKQHQAMGLVNKSGLVMLSQAVFSSNQIELCFEHEDLHLLKDQLEPVPFDLLSDSGILFFRINHSVINSPVSNNYLNFLNKVIFEIYRACKIIFSYTYEHLSNRNYDNKKITQLESVQFQFSDVYILLERIRYILSTTLNKDKISFVISLLINALDMLSKLAGARAILKNNSIELLVCLKTFQKFVT